MIIPDKFTHLPVDLSALVIVAAKEHGVIYRIEDGTIEHVSKIEHGEPSHSDDEGFFFKAAGGNTMIGGAPKESDEAVYKKELDRQIASELDTLIKQEKTDLLYIFEPEHLKDRITAELQKHPDLTIHSVRYGNYVDEKPEVILKYIDQFIADHDPESVDTFDEDLKQSS